MQPMTVSPLFLLFSATEKVIENAGRKSGASLGKPIWDTLEEKAKGLAAADESARRWHAFEKAFEAAKTDFLKVSHHPKIARIFFDIFVTPNDISRSNSEWLIPLLDQFEKLSVVSSEPDVDALVNLSLAALERKGMEAPARADLADVVRDFIAVFRNGLFAEPAYRQLVQDPALWEHLNIHYDTRERYLAQLIRYCQQLDFVGLPGTERRVKDVFIDPQSEAEIQPDSQGAKGRGRKHPLENERRRGKERPEKISRRLPIKQALAENSKMVVLGDPGSGKTTLLKYIALAFAENHPERLALQEMRLPVFIRLYDYVVKRAQSTDGAFSLIDHIDQFVNAQLQVNLPPGFFAAALEQGACCVCLDGLDEFSTAGWRREVAAAVMALTDRYPNNRYVVASRPSGYEKFSLERREFTHHTLQPFSHDDIFLYIEKWLMAREKSPQGHQEHVTRLARAILEHDRIRSLAGNPLMLTMAALAYHHASSELPQERVQLFDQCATMLVQSWGSAKYSLRRRLLEKLAYWMHTQSGPPALGSFEAQLRNALENDPKLELNEEQIQAEIDEFLALARKQGGLLVERHEGFYTFAHLGFQDFLAACDIEKRLAHSSDALWKEIHPHLHDPHWRGVILLLLGSLNRFEQHNTELVGRIYHTSDAYENLLHRHLFLAARALSDHVEVRANLRNEIVDALLALAASPELASWDAFTPLGALREERRTALGLLALAHNPKATVGMRLLAAQALGQLGHADDESQILLALAHDEEVHADVRSAATQAMGQVAHTSQLVLHGLLLLAQNERVYPYVRSDAARVLGQLGHSDETLLDGLLTLARDDKASERVRRAAAQSLGQLGRAGETVLSGLLALAQDEKTEREVRSAAAQSLGQLGHANETVLSGLLTLAQDKDADPGIRCDAADALGQLGWVDHASIILLALARDEKAGPWVRSDAADALGQLGRVGEAATVLLELAQDERIDVGARSEAAYTLGQLGHTWEATLSGLLSLAQDNKTDARLRSEAAQSLAQLGHTEEAIAILDALTQDTSVGFWVRSDAAQALVQLGHPSGTTVLMALAQEEGTTPGARIAALQAIEQQRTVDQITLNTLLSLAQNEKIDPGVSSAAVQALGKLGRTDETVLNSLLALLQNPKLDPAVHSAAAQALGQFKRADSAVLHGLLILARNENVDPWVRREAIEALGQVGHADESVLHSLLALAQNATARPGLRGAAYHSLKSLLGDV